MADNSGGDPEKLELKMTMGFSGKIVEDIRVLVGGVAQWLERRSLAGDFPCPALDLQLMDDH